MCHLDCISRVRAHKPPVTMSLGLLTLLTIDINLIIARIVCPSRFLTLSCSRDSLCSNPKKIVCSIMIDVVEEGMESW